MGFGTNLIVAPTCFALGIIFCNWYSSDRNKLMDRTADHDVL
jgi:hypothetical protein